MKSKMFFVPVVMLLFLYLTACGEESSNRVTGEVTYTEQGGGAAAETSSQGEAASALETTGSESASAVTANGYSFVFQGIEIVIDADFAGALARLGEPLAYFEAESCAFPGLDKTYTYDGFEIDTYPQGDSDLVSVIVLRDDTVATPEGVRIGSTKEDVEAAYGAASEGAAGQIIYESDNMRLCFALDGDSVVAIEYQTNVLVDG